MFSSENDERLQEGKSMCVCKRNMTDRSSIRMGWDHMVSEMSAESSKIQFRGHRKKTEKGDWEGVSTGV